MPLSAVKLLGRHLLADVLAASAVASLAGVDAAAMTTAVEGFTGLEHALEPVGEIGGVRFVNDSKATNIEAARRAIESFGDGVVVDPRRPVQGRRLRGPGAAARSNARATVVAIGEAAPLIREALAVGGDRATRPTTCRRRCAQAFASASPGQHGRAAPACASFDMFRDYAERGRVFKQEVRAKLRASEWNRRDARAVSSHQSGRAVKNRPLGTQAAPVCEGGVFARGRLMTADCSRGLRAFGGTPPRLRLLVGSSPRDL